MSKTESAGTIELSEKKKVVTNRYSDQELLEFKEIILKKLEKAQGDYNIFKVSIRTDDNSTDDTDHRIEEGSCLPKEESEKLAQRQLKFIQHLQAALVRIENKTYGICKETGKLISKERLRAVPHAMCDAGEKDFQKSQQPARRRGW